MPVGLNTIDCLLILFRGRGHDVICINGSSDITNDYVEKLFERSTRGRKRASARPILDGLIYHFRTGCQWNQIPEVYGDDSTIHRTLHRWVKIAIGCGHN